LQTAYDLALSRPSKPTTEIFARHDGVMQASAAVTAGRGHAGQAGVTMPGKGDDHS
jgi:hypothetical protein